MLKWLGVLLIVGGCGGCGFSMAAEFRREEGSLRQMQNALEILQCEIQCRLTPLPEICGILTRACTGAVGEFFSALQQELDLPDAGEFHVCAGAAVSRVPTLPQACREILLELCATLGRYDTEGQMRSIAAAKEKTQRKLEEIMEGQAGRLKSYKALGICGGAALAILLL